MSIAESTRATGLAWTEFSMHNRGGQQVPDDQDLEQLTAMFRLLSDKTRLSILALLSQGERNVTTLCQLLKLPQPTVSHHLGLLRMNNMIGNRRSGKQVFYALNGVVERDERGGLQIDVDKFILRINDRAPQPPTNGPALQ